MIFLITLTLIFCSCIELGLLAVYDRHCCVVTFHFLGSLSSKIKSLKGELL